ncbi:SGNH/GDSL hydrolase family protein [Flavihumibacter sp. CACIAM 22H1]|uniref:SGNH/GDSL hydrolase family protein n=1 Tax=Flavihumibacter sp. CACIAM 22H1 TaxID=1812911 RepID=UPI0025BA0C98|nr:SGNH/GDSL hydrolase family protein [Flavihumibacter sp. CACIAM 22H1]
MPKLAMIRYLALGDSYTVGEQVTLTESFPYQLVQSLRLKGWEINAPEILAKTGWTTDELLAGMESFRFLPSYDWVSLLIGVNNQYRGWPIDTYATEFEQLLRKAIQLAGGKKERVVVLSIPDWGHTPFAADRNRQQISTEINAFNQINKQLAEKQAVYYIDITEGTREAVSDPALVAQDGLHPSGLEYQRWARFLFDYLSPNAGGSIPNARK